MKVKEKERKTTSFFSWREEFSPRAEASLCFVSWRGRHIIQELSTNFQKEEKTDRVDSPSRKAILKVSSV